MSEGGTDVKKSLSFFRGPFKWVCSFGCPVKTIKRGYPPKHTPVLEYVNIQCKLHIYIYIYVCVVNFQISDVMSRKP